MLQSDHQPLFSSTCALLVNSQSLPLSSVPEIAVGPGPRLLPCAVCNAGKEYGPLTK